MATSDVDNFAGSANSEATTCAGDSPPGSHPQASAADAFRRLSSVQPAVRSAVKRPPGDRKIGAPEEGQGEKPDPAPDPGPKPAATEPPAK